MRPATPDVPLTARQRRRVERYAATWKPGAFLRKVYPALYRAATATGMDHDDIDQCAWVGVLRAAQKYRPGTTARGRVVRFHTYANWWVRGAVTHAVRRAAARGREGAVVLSGDRPAGPGDDRPLWDAMGVAAPTPACPAVAAEVREQLAGAMRFLPPRHRRVVELRAAGGTLEEVGAELGVTRERVRQMENAARERIRVPLALACGEG
jgi:RNA polymerase sigma factor (sigma-70 family)